MRSTLRRGIVFFSLLSLALAPLSGLRAAETAADKEAVEETKSAVGEDKAAGKDEAKTEAAEQGDAGAEAEKSSRPAGHKSPAIAGGLAFFPGVAVHGAGHMYAGSWMKGLGLLAIEGVALGIGIPTAINGADRIQKAFEGAGNGSTADAGDSFRDVGIVLVCTMAFLWTWFDDMAGAPIAANEYNRLADEAAAQTGMQVIPRADGVSVALVQHF